MAFPTKFPGLPKKELSFLAKLNEKGYDILSETNFQHKNLFEFQIINNFYNKSLALKNKTKMDIGPISNVEQPWDAYKNIINQFIGMKINKLFLQELNLSFPQIEFNEENNFTYPTKIVQPTDITLKFLEDEEGTVTRYILSWMSDIYTAVNLNKKGDIKTIALKFSEMLYEKNQFVFKDEQKATKRTGILKFLRSDYTASVVNFPSIVIYGMRPKGIQGFTASNTEEGLLNIEVNFRIDEVQIREGIF